MKKLTKNSTNIVGAFGVIMVLLVGCAGSDKTFVASADMFVNKTVGPEYINYVNADSSLSDDQKNDRILNVESFRKVVEAKK